MSFKEQKISHMRHIFSSELGEKAKVFIKYQWFMTISYRNAVISEAPGSFYVSLSSKQKFYGNISLKECSRDELIKFDVADKKIIHMGNLIFMNAQLYVITSETVMKLREANGVLLLRTSTKERRRIYKEANGK